MVLGWARQVFHIISFSCETKRSKIWGGGNKRADGTPHCQLPSTKLVFSKVQVGGKLTEYYVSLWLHCAYNLAGKTRTTHAKSRNMVESREQSLDGQVAGGESSTLPRPAHLQSLILYRHSCTQHLLQARRCLGALSSCFISRSQELCQEGMTVRVQRGGTQEAHAY